MKYFNKLIFVSILSCLISCHPYQVERPAPPKYSNEGNFKIAPLDTIWMNNYSIADTTKTYIFGPNGPSSDKRSWIGQPAPIWTIYLPFSDSLKVIINDKKGNIVYEPSKKLLSRGYHEVSVYPKMDLWKTDVYFLTFNFCDSSFVRRFFYMK